MGVDRHNCPFNCQQIQQLRDSHDLVRFFAHLDLTKHQTLPGGKSRDHVNGGLRVLLTSRTPYRLAVNRDHVAWGTSDGCHPGHKALLEFFRIKRREDIAQRVVRRRAVHIRAKAAQQFELLLAEAGNIGERLGASQHRQQAQQQHLIKRVHDFGRLTCVWKVLKMLKKRYRFAQSARRLHTALPHPKSGLR